MKPQENIVNRDVVLFLQLSVIKIKIPNLCFSGLRIGFDDTLQTLVDFMKKSTSYPAGNRTRDLCHLEMNHVAYQTRCYSVFSLKYALVECNNCQKQNSYVNETIRKAFWCTTNRHRTVWFLILLFSLIYLQRAHHMSKFFNPHNDSGLPNFAGPILEATLSNYYNYDLFPCNFQL